MKFCFEPSRLCGKVTVPPSKSELHRAFVCASLGEGETRINNIFYGDDIAASLECVKALGKTVTESGNGVIIGDKASNKINTLPCNESGSTLRFFIPAALTAGGEFNFTGSERLFERENGVYAGIFKDKGIEVSNRPDGLSVSGRITSGEYIVPGNISSQYISGLLMALPVLEGDSTVFLTSPPESSGYIDLTISVMNKFGVKVRKTENGFFVPGGQKYSLHEFTPNGDFSSAAFFYALNSMGNETEIRGVVPDSLQPDEIILSLLKSKSLSADISGCPDLGPLLFALASVKGGGEFTGVKRLKIKESDRLASMQEELLKFGIKTDYDDEIFKVYPDSLKRPEEALSSHGDHRIVMALSLLLTVTGGEIDGAENINKSYPGFFDELKRLGANIQVI